MNSRNPRSTACLVVLFRSTLAMGALYGPLLTLQGYGTQLLFSHSMILLLILKVSASGQLVDPLAPCLG